ncbi:MAG TPA: hypothetical protein VGO80_16640 [Solirubrobacteraceae bacterium]|jgi:predicted nuclease with RNAse H fold|nr:hypothetical protein [Solirubrobacteraceae bacterium]
MPQDIVVSVDPERASDVAERLREAGMQVTEVLPATGVVTGCAEPSQLTALEQIDGVVAVERTRRVDLPPPDSPVQ